jgi:hypothetical protein
MRKAAHPSTAEKAAPEMPEIIQDLIRLIQQAVGWILDIVVWIWVWSVEQISQLPWQDLTSLPLWQLILLIAAGAFVIAILVWVAMGLFQIGARLMAAIITLFAVILRTVPAVAAAGLIAAGTAYVINHFPAGDEAATPLAQDLETLDEAMEEKEEREGATVRAPQPPPQPDLPPPEGTPPPPPPQ